MRRDRGAIDTAYFPFFYYAAQQLVVRVLLLCLFLIRRARMDCAISTASYGGSLFDRLYFYAFVFSILACASLGHISV
jgi:hypothetical protein